MQLLVLLALTLAAETDDHPTVVVVVGAEGEAEYGVQFNQWADRWRAAAERGSGRLLEIGRAEKAASSVPQGEGGAPDKSRVKIEAAPHPNPLPEYRERGSEQGLGEALTTGGDCERLRELLAAEPKQSRSPLWLVLIGHGTYDGRTAKFNLRGPDVSSEELAEWLKGFERPVVVINCASSSGPFINHLSSAGRVVMTATRSGNEFNYARFGDYFSAAIADPAADLDKDDQTSLLEAYLAASRRVEEFYKEEARLATEHALLDDNGDSLGTPGAWFQGTRATRRAKDGAPLDGPRAHQLHLVRSAREETMSPELRERRDKLELAIEALRDKKTALGEAEYYAQLEKLLLELAELYEQAEPKDTAVDEKPPASASLVFPDRLESLSY
jgi:hypothetical protein